MEYWVTAGGMDTTEILVSDELMAKTDAEINAALPDNVPAGCIIHTKGYQIIKEKGLDGSWATV